MSSQGRLTLTGINLCFFLPIVELEGRTCNALVEVKSRRTSPSAAALLQRGLEVAKKDQREETSLSWSGKLNCG